MRAQPPFGRPYRLVFVQFRVENRLTLFLGLLCAFVPRLPEFGTDHGFLSSHFE
jgi:hypothetical protein